MGVILNRYYEINEEQQGAENVEGLPPEAETAPVEERKVAGGVVGIGAVGGLGKKFG